MSELSPRDREVEARRRTRGRRRRVAIGVGIALVVAIGVGQLTFGLVSRVIDATGWTCGSGWERIDADELADMRVLRWGTPEARQQGFDPKDFTELPAGLAEPSLTTAAEPDSGYDPLLYPLDGGVVVQSDGYQDRTWVGADAVTGDPLWGFASSSSGFSTVQGFGLVSGREDGRTDLTTFDPRTGEELSCVRLAGEVLHIDTIGEDLVVALSIEGDDENSYRMVRLDPASGDIAWDQPLSVYPASVHTAGGEIVISSRHIGAIATQWGGGGAPSSITVLDPRSGEQLRQTEVPAGEVAVVGTALLPEGGAATLGLEIADREDWSDGIGEYVLIDGQGEELWRTEARFGRDEAGFWSAGDVLVVLENYQPVGIDIRTGERLWQADGAGMADDIAVLDPGSGPVLVLSDQHAESGDFVTHLIDPRTGEATVVDAPLQSFRLTDSYVLSTTPRTQIVIPLDS